MDFLRQHKAKIDLEKCAVSLKGSKTLSDCDEVLRPCQQLRSCRAGQLPFNTVPG